MTTVGYNPILCNIQNSQSKEIAVLLKTVKRTAQLVNKSPPPSLSSEDQSRLRTVVET